MIRIEKTKALSIIICLSLFAFFIHCSNSNKTASVSESDVMAEIAEAVKGKRVVALGESSHGIGEFFKTKSELVQYLHKHHDFDVLAFESGLSDLNLAWSNIDSLSGLELLDKTLFGNFQCEEIIGLFEYIKTQSQSDHPLIYSGFDNQMSSSFFQNAIEPIIEHYDNALAQRLEEDLKAYVRWFRAGYYNDEAVFHKEAKVFVNLANDIQSIFDTYRTEIKKKFGWNDFQFEVVKRTTLGFKRTVDLPYEEKGRGSEHRDAIMFDNFKWLMEEIYPDKKILVWAHNGHVERKTFYEYGYKWMGHHLAEYIPEDYYTIGLFAKRGSAYRQWGDTTIVFNNDTIGMIESLVEFGDLNTSFVDFRMTDHSWSNDTLSAFEVENGGVVDFIPDERFDGVLLFDSVSAPTFLNH